MGTHVLSHSWLCPDSAFCLREFYEAACAVGVERESGSLERGKRGDVLLLDADPLADIHNARKVWRTAAKGVVYEPAPLWRSVGFTP
jgi:hypothetical protein